MAVLANMVVVLMVAAVVAAMVPTTLAVQYVVGDEAGWTNRGVDYTAWAEGKKFVVGDSLVFNYAVGNHNVMKVNGTDFLACTKPLAGPAPLTSGKDTISLLTTGRKWYICGAPGHCDAGQKLVITVSDHSRAAAPAPTPSSPPNAAAGGIASIGFAAVTVVGVIGMLLF